VRDFATVARRSAVREVSADPTPLPTKVMLVVALAVAAWAVAVFTASRTHPARADDAALSLFVLTALFVFRVAGQLLVRTRAPTWLPSNEYWALTPYAVLLPVQLAVVGLLTWIDVHFARGYGSWTDPRPALGSAVIWFSLIYGGAMLVRYVWRMSRLPRQRWFGGTIPIVFHWVLAAYLFVFGSFHASH
jgi:hypothetical protein